MRNGTLKNLVSIQQPFATLDDYGQVITTWAEIFTAWVSIVPVTAREFVNDRGLAQEVTHKITLHWKDGINSGCRIVWGSRVFNISQPPINTNEANRECQILAKEIV
jgi:SPP1 family predicted phage head-tail adaptor